MFKTVLKIFGVVLVFLGQLGCELPVEKNLKKGKLLALVSEPHALLLARQAEEFHRLYPDTEVSIKTTSTRDGSIAVLTHPNTLLAMHIQTHVSFHRAGPP